MVLKQLIIFVSMEIEAMLRIFTAVFSLLVFIATAVVRQQVINVTLFNQTATSSANLIVNAGGNTINFRTIYLHGNSSKWPWFTMDKIFKRIDSMPRTIVPSWLVFAHAQLSADIVAARLLVWWQVRRNEPKQSYPISLPPNGGSRLVQCRSKLSPGPRSHQETSVPHRCE